MLDFLWESHGVGELPYPLELTSHGSTVDDRARLRNETFGRLRTLGVMDPHGGLDSRLAEWLGLLGSGERSVDSVFLPGDDEPLRGMVAVESTDRAVLASQEPDGVLLRKLHPGGIASAVIDALPPGNRGTEPSFTAPADQAEGRSILTEPRLRGGQFGVNHRSTVNGRTRARVLAWFDVRSGRYLMYRKPASDGRDWITVAPADAPTLRHRINELLTTAART